MISCVKHGSPRRLCGDYEVADEYLKRARDGFSRPIANNTRLRRELGWEHPLNGESEHIAINLHGTNVVLLYPNGDTTFHSGGWRTRATQSRMNLHPDFGVYSYYGPEFNDWTITSYKAERRARERLYRKYGFAGRTSAEFLAELAAATHTYVWEDGITFSKRGACLTPGATRLPDRLAAIHRARASKNRLRYAASSMAWKAVRRLRRGMALPNCAGCEGPGRIEHLANHVTNRSVSTEIIQSSVEWWLEDRGQSRSDWRFWLNLHHNRNGDLAIGGRELPTAVEPYIRQAVFRWLRAAVPHGLTPPFIPF